MPEIKPVRKASRDQQLTGELTGELATYENVGLFQHSVTKRTAYRLALALEEDDREAFSRWLDKLAEYNVPFLYDVPPSARHLIYERWGETRRKRLQAE